MKEGETEEEREWKTRREETPDTPLINRCNGSWIIVMEARLVPATLILYLCLKGELPARTCWCTYLTSVLSATHEFQLYER